MKISEAKLGYEYTLKNLVNGVNHAFVGARIKFLRVTGSHFSIEFKQLNGHSGTTDIGTTDGAWEIIPIIKDWDV
jgi:hypothetical protein